MKKSKAMRIFAYCMIGLAVLLLIARIAAPVIMKKTVNNQLQNAEAISGMIEDIDLHLYRGGYEIEGLKITDRKSGGPLLEAAEIDISIFWGALLKGKLVAEVDLIEPSVSIFDTQKPKERDNYKKISEDKAWFTLFDSIVPISIDVIRIKDGKFAFEAKRPSLEATFFISDLNGSATNITGKDGSGQRVTSDVSLAALAYNESKISVNGTADVRESKPTFDMDVSAEKIALKHFDKIIRVYAPFDIEAGSLDFAAEMQSLKGKADGYVKIGVYNLDVFSWRKDIEKDGDNLFQAFIDGLIGGVSFLLESQKTELVATKIPIDGDLSNPEIPVFQAVGGLFKNAFVDAYKIKVDNLLSFGSSQDKLQSLGSLRKESKKDKEEAQTPGQESDGEPQKNESESPIKKIKGA